MATIMDVARRAGVSMKTVSRVLNNEAHVRPALRERVTEAVQALQYRPNLAARQLAGSRSFIIAYPFNNPDAAYITNTLMGAAKACRDRGYHLVSEPIELDESAHGVIERLITTLRPDGIMLTPPLSDMVAIVEQIAEFDIPLVRLAGRSDLIGRSIFIDDREASRMMTEHLLSLGHRRIGFISPHPDHATAQGRYQGFLDGLAQAGLGHSRELLQTGYFDFESGVRAATAFLDLTLPPTAIYAANDQMATGALHVVHQRGMRIPEDVAIAGFDDAPASRTTWPQLTTVQQPLQQLGECAARMLMGELPPVTELKHQLIIRGSTRPAG